MRRWCGVIGSRLGVVGVVGLALAVGGCRKNETEDRPEKAVAEWIEDMSHLQPDPKSAQAAYDLLSKEAKANLIDRARRTSAATGRHVRPESMLVPSRFHLRFSIRSMQSHVAGDRAVVEVLGDSRRAEVPCVKEDGHWRIDLVIPQLPEVEKRPDAGL